MLDHLLLINAVLYLYFYFSVMGTQSERVDIIVDVVIKADTRFVDFSVGVSHIKVEVCKTEFSVVNIICPSRYVLAYS